MGIISAGSHPTSMYRAPGSAQRQQAQAMGSLIAPAAASAAAAATTSTLFGGAGAAANRRYSNSLARPLPPVSTQPQFQTQQPKRRRGGFFKKLFGGIGKVFKGIIGLPGKLIQGTMGAVGLGGNR